MQPLSHYFIVSGEPRHLTVTLVASQIFPAAVKQLHQSLLHPDINQLTLNFMDGQSFDDQCMEALLQALPLTLQQLSVDFSGCTSLSANALVELLKRISAMELQQLHLDIAQIGTVNDVVIKALAILLEDQQQLRVLYLDLYDNVFVTDEGLNALSSSLQQLTALESLFIDISGLELLTEDGLELLFGSLTCTHAKSLTLNIANNDNIGGGSMFRLAKQLHQFASLEELGLRISGLFQCPILPVVAVLKSVGELAKLSTLQLNLADMRLTDKALDSLLLPERLVSVDIDLNSNETITDKWIARLCENLPPRLEKLAVNFDLCSRISEEALVRLFQKFLGSRYAAELENKDRELQSRQLPRLFSEAMENRNVHLRRMELNVSKQYTRIENSVSRYLKIRSLQLALAQRLGRTLHGSFIQNILSLM